MKADNSLICSSSTASSSSAFPFAHRAICYQTQRVRLSRIQLPKQRHLLTVECTSIFHLVPHCQPHMQGYPYKPSCTKHHNNTESPRGFSCASTVITTCTLLWYTCYDALACLYYDISHTHAYIVSTFSKECSSQLPSSVIIARLQLFTERPCTNWKVTPDKEFEELRFWKLTQVLYSSISLKDILQTFFRENLRICILSQNNPGVIKQR